MHPFIKGLRFLPLLITTLLLAGCVLDGTGSSTPSAQASSKPASAGDASSSPSADPARPCAAIGFSFAPNTLTRNAIWLYNRSGSDAGLFGPVILQTTQLREPDGINPIWRITLTFKRTNVWLAGITIKQDGVVRRASLQEEAAQSIDPPVTATEVFFIIQNPAFPNVTLPDEYRKHVSGC